MRQTKRSAGFTLLELLLVLMILGMASVLLAPTITNMDGRSFRVQVREAHTLLNYARRIAVVKGQPTKARFNISAESSDPTSRNDRSQRASSDAQPATGSGWTSQGVAVTYRDSTDREVDVLDVVEITFYPEGGSTGGELVLVQGELAATISVDPFSGRVETNYAE